MISALVNEERQNMPSDGSQPQGADSKRNQSRQTTRGNRIWTFWARRSVMQRYCIAIVLHHTGVYFFLTSLFLDKLSIRLTSSVIYFLSPAYLFFNMHTPANMMRASPVHQPDPYLTSNLYIWRGRDVRCQMSVNILQGEWEINILFSFSCIHKRVISGGTALGFPKHRLCVKMHWFWSNRSC